MKKLLLLDFDGVFNAASNLILPSDKGPLTQWEDLTEFSIPVPSVLGDRDSKRMNMRTMVSPTVVSTVINMFSDNVEVRWFTSWFDDTEMFPEVLGFPELPFDGHHTMLTDDEEEWWKLTFLKENHLDREIVWVDDDFDEHGVFEWFAAQNGRVQGLKTNKRTGLTAQDLETLHTLLNN